MFNYVDAILLVIFFLILYHGYRRGFILGLYDIFALAASFLAAFYFYQYLATFVDDHIAKVEERWLFPLSFFLALIIFRLIFGLVVIKLINQVTVKTQNHKINQIGGLIPGFFKGYFLTALFSIIFLFLPIWSNLPQDARDSYFTNYLSQSIEVLDQQIAPDFSEQIKQSISKLTVEPESDATVYLNFNVENAFPNEKLENHLLVLVNKERKKIGLKPLAKDIPLRKVARAHSDDMFKKGYFSHISLEDKSPFDRIKADGIIYTTAGENLALAQTVEIAHMGLMNSPGHKANILNPKFGKVGIGIMDGGIYGIMVTQNFKN
jgi:uncharacterized protein YkwD